jgi:DNA polymerase-3 subunit gamma/tau
VQIVDQAVSRMRYSVHERILLELALVRVAQLENLEGLAALIQQVQQGGVIPPGSVPAPPSPAATPAAEKKNRPQGPVAVEPALRPSSPSTDLDGSAPPSAASLPLPPSDAPLEPPADTPLSADQVGRLWRRALDSLDDITADYAGMADAVAISGPNRVVVRFRQVYNASKAFCERPERRQTLEAVFSQVAGRRVVLEFELIRPDQAHETPPPSVISRQKQRHQAARHPLVERAVELFEAEVVKVDVASAGREPQDQTGS